MSKAKLVNLLIQVRRFASDLEHIKEEPAIAQQLLLEMAERLERGRTPEELAK